MGCGKNRREDMVLWPKFGFQKSVSSLTKNYFIYGKRKPATFDFLQKNYIAGTGLEMDVPLVSGSVKEIL